ncbi:casein kinase 2 regulatory subunit [Neophaeococcomyces mojaviensis]|uniref:Casein kinase 2 regulatory subunit n=1 Tax=Neophaeococcomyces mojaviensis TaxID=3383035 RepID=A0ACC2ZV27_9EURO|nr:casein kinase 2 regulatory subunit [Knufia sp. JES_112]
MSQSSSQGVDSWIATFCSLMGHEYFAEVSEDFIEDDFNLTGLQAQVPMYKEALEMILDVEPSETGSSNLSEEEEEEEEEDEGLLGDELDEPALNGRREPQPRRHGRSSSDTSVIESSAELLYGLIHARYITSRPGIQQMMEKYELAHFGYCPRVYCHGTKVLPVGRTDTPGQETVKLFCPSCLDIYTPPNSRFQAVDGAFFGTTFPSLFLMTFPDLDIAPAKKRSRDNGVNEETESVMSPNEAPIMTASRSSSLTLPSAPPIPGVNIQKDERAAQQAAALAALPPQPASINGVTTQNLAPGLGKGKIYEPKIYGFRVSERAKGGPRMRWLRSKPLDINELDEARLYHEKYGGNVDGDPDEEADEEDGDEEEEEEEEDPEGDRIMASQQSLSSKRKSRGSGRMRNGGASVPVGG